MKLRCMTMRKSKYASLDMALENGIMVFRRMSLFLGDALSFEGSESICNVQIVQGKKAYIHTNIYT